MSGDIITELAQRMGPEGPILATPEECLALDERLLELGLHLWMSPNGYTWLFGHEVIPTSLDDPQSQGASPTYPKPAAT